MKQLVWAGLAASLVMSPAIGLAQVAAPQAPAAQRESPLAVLDTLPDSPTFKQIQSRTYDFKEAGRSMNYELFVPSKYDRSRPTPLVVALHCLGSDAQHMIRYEGLTEEAEARGFLVVAPMGYNSRGWYGSRGTGRASERGDAAADPANLGELSEKDVMNVLALVRQEFNVDQRRIYLMGHSMGGGGTWYLGIKHPDLWAGLGLAAPAIYTSPEALKAITHLPVIVVQGDQDALVRVDVTRQWVAEMKRLGMQHTYIEIAGGDHMRVIARDRRNMRRIFETFDRAIRKIEPVPGAQFPVPGSRWLDDLGRSFFTSSEWKMPRADLTAPPRTWNREPGTEHRAVHHPVFCPFNCSSSHVLSGAK